MSVIFFGYIFDWIYNDQQTNKRNKRDWTLLLDGMIEHNQFRFPPSYNNIIKVLYV